MEETEVIAVQLVFRSTQVIEARLTHSILNTNHIPSVLRNDIVQSVSGEVPFTSIWPEVWVLDAADAERARELIANKSSLFEEPDWTCVECGETCEGTFDACWRCGSERSEE